MEKTIQGYELPVSYLAAALKSAATKDVRHYINGIYLDFPAGRIISTDGHRWPREAREHAHSSRPCG
jgi:DNA polymerase III sliding clamp (beta) subunit (PCNA family)